MAVKLKQQQTGLALHLFITQPHGSQPVQVDQRLIVATVLNQQLNQMVDQRRAIFGIIDQDFVSADGLVNLPHRLQRNGLVDGSLDKIGADLQGTLVIAGRLPVQPHLAVGFTQIIEARG